MGIDRFGNSHAPNLSYARGAIFAAPRTIFESCNGHGR